MAHIPVFARWLEMTTDRVEEFKPLVWNSEPLPVS
jgi:hypothetical protein